MSYYEKLKLGSFCHIDDLTSRQNANLRDGLHGLLVWEPGARRVRVLGNADDPFMKPFFEQKLVALPVDLIVTWGTPAALAAKQATLIADGKNKQQTQQQRCNGVWCFISRSHPAAMKPSRPRSVSLTRSTKRRAFHSALDDAGGVVMPWRANVINDPARDQRRAGSLVRCSAAAATAR